jgi:hypothetical protein
MMRKSTPVLGPGELVVALVDRLVSPWPWLSRRAAATPLATSGLDRRGAAP